MADVASILYEGQPGTTDTLLFTDNSYGTVVRSINVANVTGSPATITLGLNAGASLGDANAFFSEVTVAAHTTMSWSGFQYLSSGGTIRALQGTSSALTVTISGVVQAALGVVNGPYITYAKTINWDDANILTGHAFYTPTVGERLVEAYFQLDTPWDGTQPRGDIGQFSAGQMVGLFSIGLGVTPLMMDAIAWGPLSLGPMKGPVVTSQAAPTDSNVALSPSGFYRYQSGSYDSGGGVGSVFTTTDPLEFVVSSNGRPVGGVDLSTLVVTNDTTDAGVFLSYANGDAALIQGGGTNTSGTYTLGNGVTDTGPLAYNTPPDDVATALSTVFGGRVVSKTSYGGVYVSGSNQMTFYCGGTDPASSQGSGVIVFTVVSPINL